MDINMHLPSMAELIAALPLILSVVVLDGLLSVDNGLIIAARAQHLPDKKRRLATTIGMTFALLLRLASLFFVGFLLANPWLKLIGGAYLVHMMCNHLGHRDSSEQGNTRAAPGFAGTVTSIVIADFVFSIDNVIAAASLTPRVWVVWTGVTASMIVMMFAVQIFARLLKRFPVLEVLAYVLVGFIGLELFAEYFWHVGLDETHKVAAMAGIIVSGLLYMRVKLLQTVFGPVLSWLGRLMGAVANLVDLLLVPLVVPVKAIADWLTRVFTHK